YCSSVSLSIIVSSVILHSSSFFFLFTTPPTTDIYTLSLHDALPISPTRCATSRRSRRSARPCRTRKSSAGSRAGWASPNPASPRSEEHTSELQSHLNLVCRLLLEKKKKKTKTHINNTHT